MEKHRKPVENREPGVKSKILKPDFFSTILYISNAAEILMKLRAHYGHNTLELWIYNGNVMVI